MINFAVVLVFFIQIIIAQNNNNIVREGAPCELSSNEKGICIRLSLCSSAREQLRQRKIPDNCGFINNVPITCCPKKPRKIARLSEKKCKYIELSRFGFIADAKSSESFAPSLHEEEKSYPFRINIPTTTTTTTQEDVIPRDFSRFPLEEDTIPTDFSRFPLKEEVEDKFQSKNENTNIIDFSRFPSEEKTEDITFEQEEENKFPFVFSRLGFDENDSSETHNVETKKQKTHTSQNEFRIPMDFSRFSYSPTDNTKENQISEDHTYNELMQHEFNMLPKLDFSSKDILELIIRETSNYVLGGQNSELREFPHMAALGYENNNKTLWLCGGTLISNEYVLTAAHCLNSLDYGPLMRIRLGDINRESALLQTEHQDFGVEKAIPHPLYRSSLNYHDIALVKLDRKAVINNFVNTACLFTEEKIPPSLELWATGWGLTAEGGNQSDILQKVELSLFSEEDCNKVYQAKSKLKYGILHKQQICAGGRINQKDTCKGDSGGPLQIKMSREDGDIFYIVGVTSFGKQCGNKNIPGVYTRISFYIPWIENIIWPDEQ